MAATDSRGVVSSAGTLSKATAPGLRMGFVGAPKQLLLPLAGESDNKVHKVGEIQPGGRGGFS